MSETSKTSPKPKRNSAAKKKAAKKKTAAKKPAREAARRDDLTPATADAYPLPADQAAKDVQGMAEAPGASFVPAAEVDPKEAFKLDGSGAGLKYLPDVPYEPHRPARPDKALPNVRFRVASDYEPAGDQPQAINELVEGVEANERDQVLLGVTGSGKTYTMAKIIEATQRPAIVLAHNKTLAAQLYSEFKNFFPDNAVEYFVSYYDYYMPEAYIPRTDTFIEKESTINEQIDRMRHAATRALLERDDVIIVASVSCIYGIGSVEDRKTHV